MSLNYQPLRAIQVMDPRTDFREHAYAVLRSGSYINFRPFTTNSISNSGITFTCTPPAGQSTVIDRKVYIQTPVRVTLTGTQTIGVPLLLPGYDAPRFMPFTQSCDNQKVTINGQASSIQIGDIASALLRYQTDTDLLKKDYSKAPSYPDQSQQYADLTGSVRSPLSQYDAQPDGTQTGQARGSFPFTIVTNPVGAGPDVPVVAVVDYVTTEPLMVSPCYFGKGEDQGFYNVSTFDIEVNFLNTSARWWSHDPSGGATITNTAVQFNAFNPAFSYAENQPLALFQFITLNEVTVIPRSLPIVYPYMDVIRYSTDSSNSIAAYGTPGNLDLWQFTSNNVQITSIPRRIYAFVRMRNQDLYSSCQNTDTFFQIQSPLNVQFGNQSNLVSSASRAQLYDISVQNGLQMDWMQWSGDRVQPIGAPFITGSPIGGVSGPGSILCFQPALDFGLNSLDASGKNVASYNLSITGTARNLNNFAVTPTLYIVVVNEGTFSIPQLSQALYNVGVLTSNDILNASKHPSISYHDANDVQGSGNIFSGLSGLGKRINNFLKKSKLVSTGLSFIPNPVAKVSSKLIKHMGYGEGEDEGEGGDLIPIQRMGGVRAGRKKLMSRVY